MSIPALIVIAFPTIHIGEAWARAHAACAERMPIIHNINNELYTLRGLRGHTIVYVNTGPSEEARVYAGNRNHFIKVTY